MTDDVKRRKSDHIEIGLTKDVSMSRSSGLERYYFVHQALPEIALKEVTTGTSFLGHELGAPLLISSMTGGHERAELINRNLGEAAQFLRIPMAVGSQRAMIEHPDMKGSFTAARKAAPDIPIFGNLGAVQLNYGVKFEQIQEAVDLIKGNGLFLHLNPLQEVIQPGGDTNFRGLLDKIGELTKRLKQPVLVKEVGCGIDPGIAVTLAERGVAAIDISGAGGTSWASIESLRAKEPEQQRLGEVFSNWGIPMAESLTLCRSAMPEYPFIASGGIRTGLDVAKALVLGADMVAFAMPLLKPATQSAEAVIQFLQQIINELKVAMFLIGARDLSSLKKKRHLLKKES